MLAHIMDTACVMRGGIGMEVLHTMPVMRLVLSALALLLMIVLVWGSRVVGQQCDSIEEG